GEVSADAEPADLHRMMIGSTGSDDHYHEGVAVRSDEPRRPRLEVRGLCGPSFRDVDLDVHTGEIVGIVGVHSSGREARDGPSFRDVDLDVHTGEIVGIVGVHGSGREDLCRALFGAEPTTAGEVVLDGARLDLSGTRAACAAGIGYVPAERKTEGMVGPMSVADNMTLTKQAARCTGPIVRPGKQATLVDTWIERLRIR